MVAQWKRKHQKMSNEMNDLRMLLEEQNARNNILEKKQRKFDSECAAIKDAVRTEKLAKEKLAQEKEMLIAEKFTLEQSLAVSRRGRRKKKKEEQAMRVLLSTPYRSVFLILSRELPPPTRNRRTGRKVSFQNNNSHTHLWSFFAVAGHQIGSGAEGGTLVGHAKGTGRPVLCRRH